MAASPHAAAAAAAAAAIASDFADAPAAEPVSPFKPQRAQDPRQRPVIVPNDAMASVARRLTLRSIVRSRIRVWSGEGRPTR